MLQAAFLAPLVLSQAQQASAKGKMIVPFILRWDSVRIADLRKCTHCFKMIVTYVEMDLAYCPGAYHMVIILEVTYVPANSSH